jgi:hypothetical protein
VGANLTQPTLIDPQQFVAAVEHPGRRADAEALLELFGRVTGWQPQMWGPSIVGFGSYRYRLANGREEASLATGFSPRSANTVLYVVSGYDDLADELAVLGKHKVGKSCLYVNRIADVDLAVLERIIRRGLDTLAERHPVSPS